ncbi:MAG: aminotransferase class I/II-fold pyridoxal phosphate-dependent enzyme [Phycisphaerales bacterium]|nr:aminotransferase class I/II-fold pyridoxal phosphate-dependent enzyme [Phycisphaerales bacterium]
MPPAPALTPPGTDLRADRLRKLPPFLFNAIDDMKRAAIAACKDVINLGVGDPDRPTPPFIIDELDKAARVPLNHQYPACYGTGRFLGAASAFMQRRFGVTVDPKKNMVALMGGKDGIGHLPLALLNPGDGAIVFAPAYPVYKQGAIMAGAKVHVLETSPAHRWTPQPAQLSDDLLNASKLMWLNFPGNPTGVTIGSGELSVLARRALDHGVSVASDLAYSELYFDGAGPVACPSLLAAPGIDHLRDHVIEFHSLSKTFNMTGWRIGFAVGHESLISALKQVKDNYDSGPFNAVQDAAAVALERFDDPLIIDVRHEYQVRRDAAVAALRQIGCQVEPPRAGIFVWARCPIDSTTGEPMSSWRFVEKLIEEAGVVTVPGAGFAESASDWFRLGLTRETPRLLEAMERIKKLRF